MIFFFTSGAGLILLSSQLDPSVELHGIDVSPGKMKKKTNINKTQT